MGDASDPIHVLHVDDDVRFTALAARLLAQANGSFVVEEEADPERALSRVVGGESDIDCVVTDLEMPTMSGLDLLESIRAERPELPVILFTGRGSEDVASEAIAAGVTDYLQKGSGTEQFTILANRIENAVAGYRARREHERAERRFRKLVEEFVDVVAVFDTDGIFEYLSPAAEAVVGYEPDDLIGENVFDHLHPDDRDRVTDRFGALIAGEEERVSVRCQFRGEDGTWVDLDVRGRNRLDDPDIDGLLVHGQDASGRVKRERELERYETMVNASGDPIYTTDEFADLTSVNDAAVSFLGYSREALIGEHVSTLVTDASYERGRRAVVELREDDDAGGVTIEQEYVTADGETVPTEAHITLMRDATGSFQGTVGVARDISTRKEREATFRALQEATHDLVAAESRTAVVELLVDTAKNVIGLPLVGLWLYDPEERALRPEVYPDDPVVPDEAPVYRKGDGLSWEAFATGESLAFNDVSAERDRYNPKSAIGSEIIVPIGEHGVLNSGSTETAAFDETDRYLADILARNAATALDRIERESVLERLHGATRELMEAGDRREIAERTLATARDVLGHEHVVVRLYDETTDELEPVAATGHAKAATDGRAVQRPGDGSAGTAFARGKAMGFETQSTVDGVEREQATFCVPIGDHGVVTIADAGPAAFDDPVVQLVKVLASNAETAIDRVDREAELARQNERLAEFASVASHDLRNPLNVAMTQVEFLRDDRDSDGLDRLARSLDRMDDIIRDVLSLARGGREVVDLEPVEVPSLVREAWSTVETGSATLEIDDEIDRVITDRSRLRQVAENLFRNAVEHGGEHVSVRVGSMEAGLYVEDDGTGIPADERERAFESGYTTNREGTGFGLTIVRRIADAHGWDVSIRDGDRGGTRVELTGVQWA